MNTGAVSALRIILTAVTISVIGEKKSHSWRWTVFHDIPISVALLLSLHSLPLCNNTVKLSQTWTLQYTHSPLPKMPPLNVYNLVFIFLPPVPLKLTPSQHVNLAAMGINIVWDKQSYCALSLASVDSLVPTGGSASQGNPRSETDRLRLDSAGRGGAWTHTLTAHKLVFLILRHFWTCLLKLLACCRHDSEATIKKTPSGDMFVSLWDLWLLWSVLKAFIVLYFWEWLKGLTTAFTQ